jgi:hypothetical protein
MGSNSRRRSRTLLMSAFGLMQSKSAVYSREQLLQRAACESAQATTLSEAPSAHCLPRRPRLYPGRGNSLLHEGRQPRPTLRADTGLPAAKNGRCWTGHMFTKMRWVRSHAKRRLRVSVHARNLHACGLQRSVAGRSEIRCGVLASKKDKSPCAQDHAVDVSPMERRARVSCGVAVRTRCGSEPEDTHPRSI